MSWDLVFWRFVCYSAIVSIATFPLVAEPGTLPWLIPPVITLLHHGSAMWPRWALHGLYDLLLLMVETVAIALVLFLPFYGMLSVVDPDSYDPLPWLHICTVLALLSSLAALLLLRIAETLRRRVEFFLITVEGPGTIRAKVTSSGDRVSPNTQGGTDLHPVFLLLGTAIGKPSFPGEKLWVIWARGILAALFIIVVVLFTFFEAIYQPLVGARVTHVKELRVTDNWFFWEDIRDSMTVDGLNVIVSRRRKVSPQVDFEDTVQVVPLTGDGILSSDSPLCTLVQSFLPDSATESLIFYCPLLELSFRNWNSQPDFQVTVNFTSSERFLSTTVMVGLTNNTDAIFAHTVPTVLLRGSNLVAFPSLEVRQPFKSPQASVFGGTLDARDTFPIAQMVPVYNRPLAGNDTASPNISTIHIFTEELKLCRPSTYVKVIRDYREKMMLDGFASVGGLWAFLAGAFAAIFGSSILRTLFGFKPLSVTGLAHVFHKDEIREAWMKEYPRLHADVKREPSDRGLLHVISDYHLDLDFLSKEVERTSVVTNSVEDQLLLLENAQSRHSNSVTDVENQVHQAESEERIPLQSIHRAQSATPPASNPK